MSEPQAESATPRPREKRARVLLDRALSASAGIVALSALAVSIYQAWIAREQQKMSAWPYVTQSNTGEGGYGRLVQNVGLGPALVRSMRISVDGKPVTTWGDLLMAGLKINSLTLETRDRQSGFTTSSVRPGMVLLPGTTTVLLRISEPAFARDVRLLLNDERRVRISVCYCSLYRDCWVSSSDRLEPTEVRACPAPDATLEFRS